jgi:hypothetical protein
MSRNADLCRPFAIRSPALIAFVWEHIEHGTLEVPPSLDPVDAERALEFFGFSGLVLTVPEELRALDPNPGLTMLTLLS